MSNYSGKPRVGWVHPKEVAGPNAKQATLEAGAGNITAEPPELEEIPNPRPSVAGAEYETPRDSGQMADGKTGGNYAQVKIPNLQVASDEDKDENAEN